MKIATCQNDSYLREIVTEVIGCAPVAAEDGGGFAVTVTDTVLYPEGGGQPTDHGVLGGVPVRRVSRAEGAFVARTEGPVPKGRVAMRVDWGRRYDHMQQHTAQHLLTALAQDRLGHATTSFHLSAERSDIELDVDELRPADIEALEDLANAEVRAAHPVRYRYVEPADLASLAVRTRGLPEGLEDTVRLVEIDGIDLNTCGGTHVANTAELQCIKLVGSERIRGGTRLYYVAGERARQALGDALERERTLTRLLCCGAAEHAAAIERTLTAAQTHERANRALTAELAEVSGRALAASGEPVAALHRPGADLQLLSAMARSASEVRPDLLMLLTAAEPGSQAGVFLLAGPGEAVARLGPQVATTLSGRGGGKGGRFQGKAERIDQREAALALLRAYWDEGAP